MENTEIKDAFNAFLQKDFVKSESILTGIFEQKKKEHLKEVLGLEDEPEENKTGE